MGSSGLLSLMNGRFLSGNSSVSMRQVATAVTRGTLVIICSKRYYWTVQIQVVASFFQPFSTTVPLFNKDIHSSHIQEYPNFKPQAVFQFQARPFIPIPHSCICSFCSISSFLWDGNKSVLFCTAHLLSASQKGYIFMVLKKLYFIS